VRLGEPVLENGERIQKVLVVFAHRNLVDGYLAACKNGGLKLASIDFDAFALLRAVSTPRPEGEHARTAVIAVAIGRERSIFAVSDGRVCDFARVLEWGGRTIDLALAEALEVRPADAERLKHSLSLEGHAEHPELSTEQLEEARSAVRQSLQALARELVSSLQFYQSRPGSLDIGELLLTGGCSQLAGIDAELARMLGAPVQLGNPLANVRVADGLRRPAEPGPLALAIGLALQETS
jgi:type IV pilus assembly protein PilM